MEPDYSYFDYLKNTNDSYLLNYRILLYNLIKNILNSKIKNKKNMVCLNNNGNINLLNFMSDKKLLQKSNKYSDVYKLKINTTLKISPNVTIKSIPLSFDEFSNSYNTSFSVWKELNILQLLTKLSKKRTIPNLPIIYDHYICNSCTYENVNIKNKSNKVCLLILSEYNKYNLKDWITELSLKKISATKLSEIWYNCIFQIITSLYFLYKNFQLIHYDLHWGNLLVETHDSNGYWLYKIEGISYYLPNLGFTVKLWDFGKSKSKLLFDKDYTAVIHELIDINRFTNISTWINITDSIKNKLVIPNNIINLLQSIKKNSSLKLKSIIHTNFSKYMHNKINTSIPDNIRKNTSKINYPEEVYRGEVVCYNNKFAIVQEIYKFKIYLITKISLLTEITIVKYDEVEKLLIQIPQNKSTYLNQKNLGIFNI